MLIDLRELVDRHDMKITGVIHAGAHLCEEAEVYAQVGVPKVWWIEANRDLRNAAAAALEPFDFPRSATMNHWATALLGERDGDEMPFHITNNGQSSSVLQFGTHSRVSPDVHFVDHRIMRARSLDSLVAEYAIDGCNFLNMDLQGAELLVLRGADKTLEQLAYIYTEINVDELYIDCARLPELTAFLADHGFSLAEHRLAGDPQPGMRNWVGWGDGLYVRR